MTYDTAIIECVKDPGEVFPNTKRGDIVFYPLNKSQNVCIGTERGLPSCLTMNNNKLGIRQNNPRADLHVSGTTVFDGLTSLNDSLMVRNSSILFKEKEKVQGNIRTFRDRHGTFYNQNADDKQLLKNGVISPEEALDKVNRIPVHKLKRKKDDVYIDYKAQLGCLASEVEPIYEPCTSGFQDTNSDKMIDYTKLVPLLIQSIKQLSSKIDDLERQNNV